MDNNVLNLAPCRDGTAFTWSTTLYQVLLRRKSQAGCWGHSTEKRWQDLTDNHSGKRRLQVVEPSTGVDEWVSRYGIQSLLCKGSQGSHHCQHCSGQAVFLYSSVIGQCLPHLPSIFFLWIMQPECDSVLLTWGPTSLCLFLPLCKLLGSFCSCGSMVWEWSDGETGFITQRAHGPVWTARCSGRWEMWPSS